MLNALLRSVSFYKCLGCLDCTVFRRKVLQYDAVNAEAIACLASHHFYTDQPELALRFYRRMLQNGVASAVAGFSGEELYVFAGDTDLK